MDKEMKITVQYPNPEFAYDFTVEGAFETDRELFLLGWHEEHQQHTILGFRGDGETGFVYPVKQQNGSYYLRAQKLKVGKTWPVYSDVSSGFWEPVDTKKIDVDLAKNVLARHVQFREITKTPDGFLY